MDAAKDYQESSSNIVNFRDFQSLAPTEKDPVLKNMQTKQEQNFNSLKAIHDSEAPL